MNYIIRKACLKRLLFYLFIGGMILQSCTDPWAERFNQEAMASETVWEILSGNQEYNAFVSLLEKAGLDSVLMRDAVFTVFVPEAAELEPLKSLSLDELNTILMFHISNAIVYTSNVTNDIKGVKTLNGKQLVLMRENGDILVNQVSRILSPDLQAINGVIHEIDYLQEIRPNLMETIETDGSFDIIADFILSGSELFFDENNSIPVGIDSIGQTIYDSIWISSNDFFASYADLSSEDQFYTIFLADDQLLDTSANGEYRGGYISSLPTYMVEGLYEEEDLPAILTSVNGKVLALPEEKYSFYNTTSNGFIYKLTNLENIYVPVTRTWEITDIPEFDSIRGIRTTDYLPYYEQLSSIRVKNLKGDFFEFRYEIKSGTLNNDYLNISTAEGTFATLEIDITDLLPGKYRLLVNATMRAADGITYDAYMNDQFISAGNNFNGGTYKFETREIGIFEIDQEKGNVLRFDIDGSNRVHTKCFIDYLIFEPTN